MSKAAPVLRRPAGRRRSNGAVTAAAPRVSAALTVAPPRVQNDAHPRVQNTQPMMFDESATARRAPAHNTRPHAAAHGPPAQNTRPANRGISVEHVVNAIEIFKRQQLTQGTCSMEQLKEMANEVLDVETGRMLEYRHLRQNPKYKEDRDVSAANEFGRLA